jgi:NADH-quinone oxidoreductase subunit B
MSEENVSGSSATTPNASLTNQPLPEELKDSVTLWNLEGAIEGLLNQLNPVVSLLDPFFNLARANSVWPLTFGTSCCAIEMMSVGMSKYDISRFGSEVFRGTPRQADLIITAGTITRKMCPALITLYEQLPEPKYVIAMGACTVTGGMFNDSYSVVQGVDRVIPVDVYLPGCPPRPEGILDALLKLQQKIRTESYVDRNSRKYKQTAVRFVDYDTGRPVEDLVNEAKLDTAVMLTGTGERDTSIRPTTSLT